MGSFIDHALMIGHYNSVNGVIHSLIWEMRISLILPFMMLPIMMWRTLGALALEVTFLAIIAAIQLKFAPPGSDFWLLQPGEKLGTAGKFALEIQ